MTSSLPPFRVKICGVTSPDQVPELCQTGLDAIGVNFSSNSPRGIGAVIAQRIAKAKSAQVKLVGVFVNESPERILQLVDEVPLDLVQLHGDESWEDYVTIARQIGAQRIIRAVRLKQSRWESAQQFAQRAINEQLAPAALLLDAYSSKAYGGTGRTLDWSKLQSRPSPVDHIPLILAGGLKVENVARAIREARPDAVDVAGGVESAPGMKDLEKTRGFVEQARWGWSPNPSQAPHASHF